jgi:hypothetical protein
VSKPARRAPFDSGDEMRLTALSAFAERPRSRTGDCGNAIGRRGCFGQLSFVSSNGLIDLGEPFAFRPVIIERRDRRRGRAGAVTRSWT